MNQAKIVECDIKVIDNYLLLANLLLLLLLSFFSRSIPITNTVKLPPLPITITPSLLFIGIYGKLEKEFLNSRGSALVCLSANRPNIL